MENAMPRRSSLGRRRQAALPLAAFACAAVHSARTFTSPVLVHQEQIFQSRATFAGPTISNIGQSPSGREGVVATEALAAGVGAKVLHAMSAGAVAAVVQAMLSSVMEPIVNRVLVKRMAVKDAIAEMTPAMIASFFTTTISTNLIKFPLFEAVAMFVALLPDMNNTVKGLIVGFIFTTATLPITNFRYRMSIQTPVSEALKPNMLYQAYLPTVIRDMVYAIARGIMTTAILSRCVGLTVSSPSVLFAVVLGSCVISAPFNEIRGYLLQSAGKKLTFSEFFKPANFVRSTSLGAMNQAIALAIGYFLTPIVAKYASILGTALDSGSWKAFFAIVGALDVVIFFISRSASKSGIMSDRLMEQLQKMEADKPAKEAQLEKYKEELAQLKAENASLTKGKALKEEIDELRALIEALPAK